MCIRDSLYGNFGMNSIFFLPVPVFVMLVLATVLSVVLNQTRYGRYLCAVGSNARVAAYSAVNEGDYPAEIRDIVRQYFSSLEP